MLVPKIPNNRLTKEIKEIVDIAVKLEGINKFVFNSPATDDEIATLEKLINYTLPEDYKEFLRFSNGMIMNNYSAEFFNTYDIIDFYDREKADSFPNDYIVIAEIIGDGEVLCLSSISGKFVRYYEGEKTFFDSFKEVLKNIIEHIKTVAEDYLLEE